MGLLQIILISVCLGCDAFAVAVAISSRGATKGSAFRLSFHFGLFQFMMPVLGWFLSKGFADIVGKSSSFLAFVLLMLIASKMLYEGFQEEDEKKYLTDRSRGWSLVLLSFATSQDALGVGISLGLMECNLIGASITIGITAALMTLAGVHMGKKFSTVFGRKAETAGAIILMIIAFSLLF